MQAGSDEQSGPKRSVRLCLGQKYVLFFFSHFSNWWFLYSNIWGLSTVSVEGTRRVCMAAMANLKTGPNNASGVVWALGMSFFFLSSFFVYWLVTISIIHKFCLWFEATRRVRDACWWLSNPGKPSPSLPPSLKLSTHGKGLCWRVSSPCKLPPPLPYLFPWKSARDTSTCISRTPASPPYFNQATTTRNSKGSRHVSEPLMSFFIFQLY